MMIVLLMSSLVRLDRCRAGRAYNRSLLARTHDTHARTHNFNVPNEEDRASARREDAARPSRNGRRIQVRRSGVHGKGVFALSAIRAGETIIEYTGELITWKEALRRHPHDPTQPNHTFYFHIDDKHVIDANVGGNAARWINHACDPNCEADEEDGRVFIKAAARHRSPARSCSTTTAW